MKKEPLALGALMLFSLTPAGSAFPVSKSSGGTKALGAKGRNSGFDFGFDFGFGGGGYMPLPDNDKKSQESEFENASLLDEKLEQQKKIQDEKVASINDALIDAVALSSAPSRNYGILEERLSQKGYFISKIKSDKGRGQDFKLTTPEGPSYVFKPLANIEKKGLMARSMAVHEVNQDGSVNPDPSSVRLSYGRIKPLEDIPKTFFTPTTGLPIEDKIAIKGFMDTTRVNYYNNYSKMMADNDVKVSTFSEDAKHGIHCFDELKKAGIKSDLRRFDPNTPKINTDLVFDFIMVKRSESKLADIATGIMDGNITNYRDDNFQIFESPSGRGMF